MEPVASPQIRALLADSLLVWKVAGEVMPAKPPAAAAIYGADGLVISVEAAAAGAHPIRWWVRWHAPGVEPRSRPCTSAIGLLRTVREVLGVDSGYRLRIAPTASASGSA